MAKITVTVNKGKTVSHNGILYSDGGELTIDDEKDKQLLESGAVTEKDEPEPEPEPASKTTKKK